MELLEKRIREEGKVLPGDILKVDGFLNHRIDPMLLDALGREFARLYKDSGVTKILTVEASGIAVAVMAGLHLGVPVLFAKKHRTANLSHDVYAADVFSFTHKTTYSIAVAKAYLTDMDRVLIIDDFLANGAAIRGLSSLVSQAGASLAGAGIAVEKGYQGGGDALRGEGMRIESLAVIESMDSSTGEIRFRR